MSEIIKHNIKYVPWKENHATKYPVYFIYSLENEYLGHITYSSKESIIFTEFKSEMKWFNVYPWPLDIPMVQCAPATTTTTVASPRATEAVTSSGADIQDK